MIVNFRARRINRGARKTNPDTYIIKKNKNKMSRLWDQVCSLAHMANAQMVGSYAAVNSQVIQFYMIQANWSAI
jgi:hypothetical protein